MADVNGEAQRRDQRDSLLVLAQLRLQSAGDAGESVRVRNVSSGGLMAQTKHSYRIGAAVVVELDGIGRIDGTVAWAEAGRIGIAFDHPIDKARARKPHPEKKNDLTIMPPVNDFRRPPVKRN